MKLRSGGPGTRGGRFVLGAEIVQRIRAGIEAAARDTTDAREEVRDAQRLEQEEAHRGLDQDDHQRRHLGGAQAGGDVVAGADHLRHRQRDQLEVDQRAAGRDHHDERGDDELGER